MRKYIAYTVMIITVLLAGCTRNDNTQLATYNISLETLGANETVDLNSYIDRNDQVGDMYNLNRITGCKILDAAGYGEELVALSNNTIYSDTDANNEVYKTANYVAYIDKTVLNFYELNNQENGIPVNKKYDLLDDVSPGTSVSHIGISASDPEMDKIYVSANYVDVYEVNLQNLEVNFAYTISDSEQRYYRNDYYLAINTDNPLMVNKYDAAADESKGGHNLGDMAFVTDSHYVISVNSGTDKVVTCIDTDTMMDCISYDLMSNSYIYKVKHIPGTDAVILKMSQDLYVLWDVYDKYGDVGQ